VVHLFLFFVLSSANALAQWQQNILVQEESPASAEAQRQPVQEESSSIKATLEQLVAALDVMQDTYFEHWLGTWPTSIDWTAEVLSTHVSAALSSLTSAPLELLFSSSTAQQALAHENLIDRYFDHISAFYFGENAFNLRNEAFDDMMWVVLGWLESIKFQNLHSELHYTSGSDTNRTEHQSWHGTQLRLPAAHRVRVFYELASQGWDNTLCHGGMVWNPYLTPYKNAVTNELFISASIGMYLYFPGDPIDSPFVAADRGKRTPDYGRHDPAYLAAAAKAYQWLKDSHMTGFGGLYADGFHIRGWRSARNPGTRQCDVLNTMIYTYNQGIVLSGLRGLWLATNSKEYLHDGHELVRKVIRATGWPNVGSSIWAGLGRGGILEEICDSSGDCSQDGHTFKGIFFHHLAEFCRSLSPEDERLIVHLAGRDGQSEADRKLLFRWHQAKCLGYRPWIELNANAALVTRNEEGKFGAWWGRPYPDPEPRFIETATLPFGAVDYRNFGDMAEGSEQLVGLLKRQQYGNTAFAFSGLDKLQNRLSMPASMGLFHRKSNTNQHPLETKESNYPFDINDRGRGRTVETQSGGLAVVRALYQWKTSPFLDS
jgi:hypothetical protein